MVNLRSKAQHQNQMEMGFVQSGHTLHNGYTMCAIEGTEDLTALLIGRAHRFLEIHDCGKDHPRCPLTILCTTSDSELVSIVICLSLLAIENDKVGAYIRIFNSLEKDLEAGVFTSVHSPTPSA